MIVTLISSDEQSFNVDSQALKHSKYLRERVNIEYSNMGAPSTSLSNVDGDTLRLVIQWCDKHKDDPIREEYDFGGDLSEWDHAFLNAIDQPSLHKLHNAAFLLEINKLKHILGKTIAEIMTRNPSQQMRRLFEEISDIAIVEK